MNRNLVLIGFFLPTLGAVTMDHLLKQPVPSELLDALVVALLFTALFALGIRLGSRRGEGRAPARNGFLHGLAAGIVVQVGMWGFWISVPHDVRYSFGIWPLLGHMLVMVLAGYLLCRVRMPSLSGA
jgi:hypothetical protein